MSDHSQAIQQQVLAAHNDNTPLVIQGSNTKSHLGRTIEGTPLTVKQHTGVINYEPDELILTVRAGTPLSELAPILEAEKQMLAFEPVSYGAEATIGGSIACGLSGPRRPYIGAARDFVLGINIINGKGEITKFGGQVIKNVAGYDVSRLMVGAMGTLGVILDVTFKVLPRPATEITLVQDLDTAAAIELANKLAAQSIPLTGACIVGSKLYIRLGGAEDGVQDSKKHIGGDLLEDSIGFWESVRELTHPFFQSTSPLWRLSLPPATPPLEDIEGETLMDWGGGLRWLKSEATPEAIFEATEKAGGHAQQYRGQEAGAETSQPINHSLLTLHQRIKHSFDPNNILNRGRLYANL